MKISETNIWSAYYRYLRSEYFNEVFYFTANSVIHAGKLVMGRGMAKEVADKFPYLPESFGKVIPHCGFYGATLWEVNSGWGAFQSKVHYKDFSTPTLIKKSVEVFSAIVDANPKITFHVNYPGIGYGGLDIDMVNPFLSQLPDRVIFHYLPTSEWKEDIEEAKKR